MNSHYPHEGIIKDSIPFENLFSQTSKLFDIFIYKI